MSILGVVVRARAEAVADVAQRLAGRPGVEVALNPGDGRLVVVMEDVDGADGDQSAARTLADVATWPGVLGTSLVWEYSGPDAPAPEGSQMADFRAWRGRPGG